MRITSLKPPRHVYDSPDGSTRWRGAQISSLGATATIKAHAEANIVRSYTNVSLILLPAGVTVGEALMVRMDGSFPYSIVETRGARFAPGAPSDQIGAAARGEFWPGVVLTS